MNRLLRSAVLICTCVLSAACSGASAYETEDIVAYAKKAVVFIRHRDALGNQSVGTGFVVDEHGYILTCAHVVAPVVRAPRTLVDLGSGSKSRSQNLVADRVWVRLSSGAVQEAQRLYCDKGSDIALIAIGGAGHSTLSLSNVEPSQGEEVILLGYPLGQILGKEVVATRGIVSALRAEGALFQLDAATNPGNSGGPVMNRQGYVVGIAFAKISGLEGFNFAISSTAIPSVGEMIASGPNLLGWLAASIKRGDVDNVSLILRLRPSMLNAEDDDGDTPLVNAATYGQERVIECLLQSGARIDEPGIGGDTPLIRAAEVGETSVAKLLVQRGANVSAANDDGITPLSGAVTSSDLELVRFLLARGADPRAADGRGDTVLHVAVYIDERASVATVLLEAGADVKARNHSGESPLHVSARWNSPAMAKLLLQHGADPNATDKCGVTPLHRAAEHNARGVTDCLISRGAKVNAKTTRSARFYVRNRKKARKDDVDSFLQRLEEVIQGNTTAPAGSTPLKIALLCENKQIADFLREHGARK